MGRKHNDRNQVLNLTWDGTYPGLADIFERLADHWDLIGVQNPAAGVQCTSRADGLRDAAKTTRGLIARHG